MNKRGVLGEQFNWIFVIVAGSILLTFFIVFTVKYVNLQQDRIDVDLSRSLSLRFLALAESNIAGGMIIDDTSEVYQFSPGHNIKMDYTCFGENAEIVMNDNDKYRMPVSQEIVFAPSEMEVSALDTWVYPWNHPFFITNVIYLSPPNKVYYLIGDSSFIQDLEMWDKIEFNIELETGISGVQPDPLSDVRFVFFGVKPLAQQVSTLGKGFKSFSALYVDYNNYAVSFFEKDSWSEELPYYYFEDDVGVENNALMYGAIFTDSKEGYACGLNRSMNRLKSVVFSCAYRLKLLAQVETTPGCTMAYGSMRSQLGQFVNSPSKQMAAMLNDMNDNLVGSDCFAAF